jgi:hypothetical protein
MSRRPPPVPSTFSSGMRNLDGRMTGRMTGQMDGKGGHTKQTKDIW